MTTSTTPGLIARPFTFDGRTFFVTPEIHNSLLRLWRLESLSDATGHSIHGTDCYSGCVAAGLCSHHSGGCRFLNVPCRCFLKHPPQ